MGPHNIRFHKEDKKYTCCNPKTMELLDCELMGVCGVISLNMVSCGRLTLVLPKARYQCSANEYLQDIVLYVF